MKKLLLFMTILALGTTVAYSNNEELTQEDPLEGTNPTEIMIALIDSNYVGNSAINDLKILLQYRVDINTQGQYGDTILHIASMYGDLNVVKFLTKNNANITIKNNKGYTPPELAAYYGHKNVVWHFIKTFGSQSETKVLSLEDCDKLNAKASWQYHKNSWKEKIKIMPFSNQIATLLTTPLAYVLLPFFPVDKEEPEQINDPIE